MLSGDPSHNPVRMRWFNTLPRGLHWDSERLIFFTLFILPSLFSVPKLLTISWTTAAPLWGSMPPNTHESRWPPRMTYLSRKHHCRITCHSRSTTEQTANDSRASKHRAFVTQRKIPRFLKTCINTLFCSDFDAWRKYECDKQRYTSTYDSNHKYRSNVILEL